MVGRGEKSNHRREVHPAGMTGRVEHCGREGRRLCAVDRSHSRARTFIISRRVRSAVLSGVAVATACTTARSSAPGKEAQGQSLPAAISEAFRPFSFDSTVEYACIGHRSQLPADTLSVEILLADEKSASSSIANVSYVRTPAGNSAPIVSLRLEQTGKSGAVGEGCGARVQRFEQRPLVCRSSCSRSPLRYRSEYRYAIRPGGHL
jgi:hypothetical protein